MSRTVRVLLVFVAVLGVLAKGAAAQIPDANDVFYGCLRFTGDGDQGRLVRLVAANEPCRPNETRVHWNVTGPQGAPGTDGTNGTSVTFLDYFSGSQYGCPNGGAIYVTGTPPVNAYVCNGKDAATATHAAGPCFDRFDNTNRYFDCGNGTVTDTVTGLIWLRQADCLGRIDWAHANRVANALAAGQCNLTDGSSPGDWRLPTDAEWRATVAKAVAIGCINEKSPTLTNNNESACLSVGPTFFSGVGYGGNYWSSTTGGAATSDAAFFAELTGGAVNGSDKDVTLIVWPVRGGQR